MDSLLHHIDRKLSKDFIKNNLDTKSRCFRVNLGIFKRRILKSWVHFLIKLFNPIHVCKALVLRISEHFFMFDNFDHEQIWGLLYFPDNSKSGSIFAVIYRKYTYWALLRTSDTLKMYFYLFRIGKYICSNILQIYF